MTVTVEVEDDAWTAALPKAADVAERAGAAAMAAARPSAGQTQREGELAPVPLGEGGVELEVTVLLADDATVRDLNGRFRRQDKPTNVLSFPAPEFARPHLGDVALAYGVCAGEAEAQGKSLADHLAHLTVHGVLHLLGWEHEAEADAEAMEAMERRILETLGVADPYQGDAHG